MKKFIILLLFIPLIFSCDKEGVNDPLIYSIEGKWLIEGMIPEGNTMYLYQDGLRYTYYCVEGDVMHYITLMRQMMEIISRTLLIIHMKMIS